MSVRHVIDQQRGLVLTVFHGELTDTDLRAHIRQLRTSLHFHWLMRELVDLRSVTEVLVSSAILGESARSLLHAPEARRALVAPTDLLFGLMRMYHTHLGVAGASQVGVFREIEPALRWIGLTEEAQLPRASNP